MWLVFLVQKQSQCPHVSHDGKKKVNRNVSNFVSLFSRGVFTVRSSTSVTCAANDSIARTCWPITVPNTANLPFRVRSVRSVSRPRSLWTSTCYCTTDENASPVRRAANSSIRCDERLSRSRTPHSLLSVFREARQFDQARGGAQGQAETKVFVSELSEGVQHQGVPGNPHPRAHERTKVHLRRVRQVIRQGAPVEGPRKNASHKPDVRV